MLPILRFIYSFLLLASGVYLYFFFLRSDLPIYNQTELAAFASTFFIVVVFAFLMLTFLAKYLPSTINGMLSILLAPLLILILNYFIKGPSAIAETLTLTGISYLTSVILAFVFIVFTYPFRLEKRQNALKAVLPQFFFILPAIFALYIFGKYLFLIHFTPPNLEVQYTYFGLILAYQTYFLAQQIKEETT